MKILRWATFIPGGVLAALLAAFPIHWVVLATFSGEDSVIQVDREGLALLERWGYAFITPLAFIYAGTWVAPSHRKQARMILGLIWAAVVSAVFVYIYGAGIVMRPLWSNLYLPVILQTLGVFLALRFTPDWIDNASGTV